MRAGAGGAAPEIQIYDQIGQSSFGEETLSAKDFARDLRALGDVSEIVCCINSPGGDVYDGVAIYNLLAQHPAKVTARIDGIAASAASLIAMAADEIVMPENAFMLVHEPMGMAVGPSETLLSVAADLARMTESFAATYSKRSGMSVEDIKALMKENRLMTAAEAKEKGFCDVLGEPVQMVASYSLAGLPAEARKTLEKVMKQQHRGKARAEMDPEQDPEDPAMEADPEEDPTMADDDPVEDPAEKTRDQQIAEHCRQIMELCNLADLPEMAPEMVAKLMPIAEVRKTLVAAKAALARQNRVLGIHGTKPKTKEVNHGWDDIVAKLNQGAGRKRA